MRKLILLCAVCLLACSAVAQERASITEKIEWSWSDRPEMPVAGLPNVLLIGDSITRAYYPDVAKDLSGIANVYLFATSACSGDPRLATQIRDYYQMMGLRFAAIHFNNGMHGWGYTEEQYGSGLPAMIEAIRAGAPKAKLIWATTTPVLRDSAKNGATNSRIDARNSLAAAIMRHDSIPTDDQHQLMLKHQELHNGDVHYTIAGSTIQASQVASMIRTLLSGNQ